MTGNSIKKTLPGMARFMILILIILILPTNVALQLYIQHQNQNSEEIFWQLEQLIRNNIYDLEREKRDFSQKCIQSAKMAAYFVEHNPGDITDLEHTKELAEKLDVIVCGVDHGQDDSHNQHDHGQDQGSYRNLFAFHFHYPFPIRLCGA